MKWKYHIIKCSSLEERRDIINFLIDEGYPVHESTTRDINSMSDFKRYPDIDVDYSGEIHLRTGKRVEPPDKYVIINGCDFDFTRSTRVKVTKTGFKIKFI